MAQPGLLLLTASDLALTRGLPSPSLQRHASDGSPVDGQFQVNTYTTGLQGPATVSSDGAGGFVVVWKSNGSGGGDTNGSSIQGQRYGAEAYLAPNSMLLMGQGDTLDRFTARKSELSSERIFVRKNDNRWPPLHTPIVWQMSKHWTPK